MPLAEFVQCTMARCHAIVKTGRCKRHPVKEDRKPTANVSRITKRSECTRVEIGEDPSGVKQTPTEGPSIAASAYPAWRQARDWELANV